MIRNMFLHKVKLKSTYTKLVLSYVLIIVLIISILSVILYQLFMGTSLKVIEADSKGRLSQNINHLNLIKSRVFSLGQQLIKDSDVIQAIYGDEVISLVDQAALIRKLRNIIDSDSIIHSIFLYNAKTNEINDTFGNESKEAFTDTMLGLLLGYNLENKFQLFPTQVSYKKSNGDIKSENIISLVISDSGYFNEKSVSNNSKAPSVGAVLINLNADAILGSIVSTPQDQKSETVVIDKNGKFIFDSMKQNFSGNVKNVEYLNSIMTSASKEGTITKKIKGEKSLIVYRKTNDVHEWIYVTVYTYKNLFSDINKLGRVIFCICIAILTVSFVFSIITARKIYTPFNMLLSRVREGLPQKETADGSGNREEVIGDAQYLTETFNAIMQKSIELESSINNSIPMVKKALLKKMIQGKQDFTPELINRFNELFREIIIKQGEECFSIVVFTLDDYKRSQGGDPEKDDIMLFSIEILIVKLISEYFQCESIDFEENYIYLLIKIKNAAFINSEASKILNRLQRDMQISLNRKISCAVGMPVRTVEDIHLSYSSAFDLIKYRLVYGYGSFFIHDMEELTLRESLVSIDKEKDRLIQAIKVCDAEGLKNEIDSIINNISQCQYDYIMLTLNQLMLDIVKSVKAFYTENSIELDFNNIYSNINKIGTLEEMREFFLLYCNAAIDKIEKKKLNRKSDMINEIITYIGEHYHEYDITTEFLANMANLTPGYFGKLFAESTGKTVNEYILELRLSKAKDLLKSTGLTINGISSKIGFSNSTYFTTLFKKSFGLTPNQYRTDNKLGM